MIGPCLCGDPACGSCGPAQGYCPNCVDEDECKCDEYDDDFDRAFRDEETE
jgi:hypothetical protein